MDLDCQPFSVNNYLNPDILENIFVHLDGRFLIHTCRFVCQRWKDIIDKPTLWRLKCQRKGIYKPRVDIELDYKTLFFFNPYGRNLLKNWNASEKFKHWHITENGGDRFKIEDNKCIYAESVDSIDVQDLLHCWVTSYGPCSKYQTIDLLREHCDEYILDTVKPDINVYEWTTARKDCASSYYLKVQLLNKNKKELDNCKKENRVPQWTGGEWTKIEHTFRDYPTGVRYIKFTHTGRDDQFWKGHYGPKFTGATVRFQFNNNS